ncbi:protein TolR [Devosia nitrariae]|uniref:Protein TolR n=1 Tax=Devosia nitrariae TaxID=2071872 RepID=A0ABQ5W9R9_9HYPH|nr:protein TolR [Devosia nitrariae]GLQ56796.1 protein TolR [Devosia nitrariae]
MGMSGAGGSAKRRGRRGRHSGLMSEINVTPMVDVMLVLLIIFMVAAPLMTVGVPIDLPQTQARELNAETQPITVSVTPDGLIYIENEQIPYENLAGVINERAAGNTEERIFVRGDTTANYGSVMQVMGLLSGAGYTRIGLITEQEPRQ